MDHSWGEKKQKNQRSWKEAGEWDALVNKDLEKLWHITGYLESHAYIQGCAPTQQKLQKVHLQLI